MFTFKGIDAVDANFFFSNANAVSVDNSHGPSDFFRTAIREYYTTPNDIDNSHPDILMLMNTIEEIYRLTAARNHYRWAIANIVVAAICVALAAYQFVIGGLAAGVVVVIVSLLAVFKASDHERKAKLIRGQVNAN